MGNKFSVIDIETTGLSHSNGDRITEIAIVVYQNGRIVDQYSSLVNPERYIPRDVVALTGIDNDMVKDAPFFDDIVVKISELLNGTIPVAHNASFDTGFINAELERASCRGQVSAICTVMLTRRMFPDLPKGYSLSALVKHFGLKQETAHRALSDALMTTELLGRHLDLIENVISEADLDGEVLHKINLEPPNTFKLNGLERGLEIAIGRRRQNEFPNTWLWPNKNKVPRKNVTNDLNSPKQSGSFQSYSSPVKRQSEVLKESSELADVASTASNSNQNDSSSKFWWIVGVIILLIIINQ